MTQSVDMASVVIAVLCGLTALLLLRVGLPQTRVWFRYGAGISGLQAFRLKTSLLSNSFALYLIWRGAVYLDYALFGSSVVGGLGVRWPIELVISFLLLVASAYTAGLYLTVQSRASDLRLNTAQADRIEANVTETTERLRRSGVGDEAS